MGSNFSSGKYKVDIVMCIDATASMGSLLDKVKENALSFYSDLTDAMEEKGKHIDELRVRVIAFRDYLADGEHAMQATDFYSLPRDAKEFERLVKSIQPRGGGDDPEDGLEALAYAINSKWATGSDKLRHIIVVWSDEGTHPLGFGGNPENGKYLKMSYDKVIENANRYPTKMAKSFDELTRWWGDESEPGRMNQRAKRLLIYAPGKAYWGAISDSWEKVLHSPSIAGEGLRDVEYKEILDAIRNTIIMI